MKIEHVGLWVKDLEAMKNFYETYFHASSNAKYHNQKTGFSSYFLTFEGEGRLELMHQAEKQQPAAADAIGYAHLAFSLGSKVAVDQFAAAYQAEGHQVINGPRTTGDGYYEAVIRDPENNQIEITA